MNTILTLSTDIGQDDYIVGAIKGQLLSAKPSFNIQDITHHLSQSNFPKSSYVCGNAFKYFPPNTIHWIILNLFDTESDFYLLAKYHDQYIACPNNGILMMVTNNIKPSEIIALKINRQQNFLQITEVIASYLSKIDVGFDIHSLGDSVSDITTNNELNPIIGSDYIEGQVLFIDRFENVVINITKDQFETVRNGRNFAVKFVRDEVITEFSSNYASVVPGEKLAWFNSAGFLELAMNKGNLAGLFGIGGFRPDKNLTQAQLQKYWFYETVRIFFF